MAKVELTKEQVAGLEYLSKLPKLTVNSKTAKKGVGRYTPKTAGAPNLPQVYTNALYKLSATHERMDALGHKATAKILLGQIKEVEELLARSVAHWDADAKEAADFVKKLDVARIGDLGIKPEAMREFLDSQKD